MSHRQQRIVRMTGHFLRKVLQAYDVDLPLDAEIISVRHKPFSDSIELLVSSREYSSVPEGAEPIVHSLISASEKIR